MRYSCFELGFHILIAGFAEKSEHIFLVRFDTGLVKRIYSEKISRDSTRELKEVNERAKRRCGSVGKLDYNVRHATVIVCEECCGHGSFVYVVELATGDEVKTVNVGLVVRNGEFRSAVAYGNNRFKQSSLPCLYVLTE